MTQRLFDCQTVAFDRKTIRCTLAVVCCESSLQSADCNVIRDEMSKVLHSMLKSSNSLTILSVDADLMMLIMRHMFVFTDCERFFSFTDDFFFVFFDVFRTVNVVFR